MWWWLALLGCEQDDILALPVEAFAPTDMVVEGDPALVVTTGTTATYVVDITWPTADGRAPLDQISDLSPDFIADPEDGCFNSGRWLEEGVRWEFEVTPTRDGLACETVLQLRMTSPASSLTVRSPVLRTRSVPASVDLLVLPTSELRLAPGERRPLVAFAWSPPQAALIGASRARHHAAHPRTWTSSDPGVFTVDEDGVLQGIGFGEATLTVEAGGVSTSASVTVEDLPLGPPGPGWLAWAEGPARWSDASRPIDRASAWVERDGVEEGPVFLVGADVGLQAGDDVASLGRHLLLQWTGTGFGYRWVGEPWDRLSAPRLHVQGDDVWFALHNDFDARIEVWRTAIDGPAPFETWALPTGYDDVGTVVPLYRPDDVEPGDFDTRRDGLLESHDLAWWPDGNQTLLAYTHYTSQVQTDHPDGEVYCPGTTRLVTFGGASEPTVELVDQRWGYTNPSGGVDCDAVGIELGYSRVGLSPSGVFGSRPHVELRGDDWGATALQFDGSTWGPAPELGYVDPFAIGEADDGVYSEVVSFGPPDAPRLGVPPYIGIGYTQRPMYQPEAEPVEVGDTLGRALHPDGRTAYLMRNDAADPSQAARLFVVERAFWPPLPDGDLATGRLLPGLPDGDAGKLAWVDGEPVPLGDAGPVVVYPSLPVQPLREVVWPAPDGPRSIADVGSDGLTLLRPGFPFVPLGWDDLDVSAATPAGDLWAWGGDPLTPALYLLPADATVPVAIPEPVAGATVVRLLGRPGGGAVVIQVTANDEFWSWIDATGAVEHTHTGDRSSLPVQPSLTAVEDDTVAWFSFDGVPALEVSSDGVMWTAHELPGPPEPEPEDWRAELFADEQGWNLVQPEFDPYRGSLLMHRRSTDQGETWGPATLLYLDGPSYQRPCSAAPSPDGSELALLMQTNDTAAPTIYASPRVFDMQGCSTLLVVPHP